MTDFHNLDIFVWSHFFNLKKLFSFLFRDRNWQLIPSQYRNQLGLTFEDDGEFYMSFRDFLKVALNYCLTVLVLYLWLIVVSFKLKQSTQLLKVYKLT